MTLDDLLARTGGAGVVALLADAEDLDRLALRHAARSGVLAREPRDRGVEARRTGRARRCRRRADASGRGRCRPSSARRARRRLMPAARLASTLLHALGIGARRLGRLWARRSFAAATICIALVIFCVALTEAMRLRRSFKTRHMRLSLSGQRCPSKGSGERLGEGVRRGLELACRRVVRQILRWRMSSRMSALAGCAASRSSPSSKGRTRLTGSGSR